MGNLSIKKTPSFKNNFSKTNLQINKTRSYMRIVLNYMHASNPVLRPWPPVTPRCLTLFQLILGAKIELFHNVPISGCMENSYTEVLQSVNGFTTLTCIRLYKLIRLYKHPHEAEDVRHGPFAEMGEGYFRLNFSQSLKPIIVVPVSIALFFSSLCFLFSVSAVILASIDFSSASSTDGNWDWGKNNRYL